MNFLDSVQVFPKEASLLNESISIVANHLITENLSEDVAIAIRLLEREMNNQNVDIQNIRRLNLFLCKNKQFSIKIDDVGNHVALAIINCDALEKIEYQVRRVAVIVEEMVHFYWRITDELKIKHVVLYIINIGWPLITMDDLFCLNTIDLDSQRQLLDLDPSAFDDKINIA